MVDAGHTRTVGRTTVRIRRAAHARVPNQDAVAGEYGGQEAAGQQTPSPPSPPFPPCQPSWPDLGAGVALTVDPSMPPPTTAQTPFCDWPAGSQVPSYPEDCRGFLPPQPRLSNVGRGLRARVLSRQAALLHGSIPRPASGCPQFWEPCGTYMGKVRCCPSGKGTTDPSWVSPKRPHWPSKEPSPIRRRGRRRRSGAPSGRGLPPCRDAACCSLYCTEKFPNSGLLWKSCMTTCKAVNRIRTPSPAIRRRNQELRFARTAAAIVDLVGRGPG